MAPFLELKPHMIFAIKIFVTSFCEKIAEFCAKFWKKSVKNDEIFSYYSLSYTDKELIVAHWRGCVGIASA
jgi:hypothetical protein